jgi:hypothetical protein
MPLDLGPADAGNVLVSDGVATVLDKVLLLQAHIEGAELRLAHFVTCPEADKFRNRKPKTKGVA